MELIFDANNFDEQLASTNIAHAGVKTVKISKTEGRVKVSVQLARLMTFDLQHRGDSVALIINNDSPEVVAMQNPQVGAFINNITSIDFKRTKNNDAQLLIYLDKQSVAVDTSDGFELCPADACAIGDDFCPTVPAEGEKPKFKVLEQLDNPDLPKLEALLSAEQIDIAGIEFVTNEAGDRFVYDINTNTN